MKLYTKHLLLLAAFTFVIPAAQPAESFANTQTTKKIAPKKIVSKQVTKKATASKISTKKKSSSAKKQKKHAPYSPPHSALVVDAATGHILYEKNAGQVRYPASLTKMMTLYMTFDALKKGTLRLDQQLAVSQKAASQPQTNISLNQGDTLPVKKAIESLVVRSANDSSMVLAEAIGQTQWNFALLMTKKARQLGMKNTIFKNPNGLPDTQQKTTAYDMARLGIALRRDFPEYYHYFSIREFSYNGVNYVTHNHVLERYNGADGIKTGYIRASGFNLVTSVKRGKYNIVAVVMGGSTANGRNNQMMALLDRTFVELERKNSGVAKRVGSADYRGEMSGLVMPVGAIANEPSMSMQGY